MSKNKGVGDIYYNVYIGLDWRYDNNALLEFYYFRGSNKSIFIEREKQDIEIILKIQYIN